MYSQRQDTHRAASGNPSFYGYYFTNPYYDIASSYIPSDIKDVFKVCQYIYYHNGVVRSATDRIAKYFITELKFEGDRTSNTEKVEDALLKHLKIKHVCANMAIDSIVYGNSITTIYLPFTRYLTCLDHPEIEQKADRVKYSFKDYKFHAYCPKCEKERHMQVVDRPLKDPSEINIIRWPLEQIHINKEFFSGKCEYWWKIPEAYKNQVKQNMGDGNINRLLLNSIPMEVLEAIEHDHDFLIEDRFIHHYRHPSLCGVENQWGFPLFVNLIKLDYHIALMRKANEVVANDYIIPMRIISPGGSGGTDPIQSLSYSNFVSHMQSMIQQHRFDPASAMISPVPVQYQAIGGEAKALDTTDLIKSITEEELHALNYPAELFFNTLNVQAMPTALRLFENNWGYIVNGLNDFVQWVSDHIVDLMGWKGEEVKFTRVTTADDIERRQVLLQLAQANVVSLITALKQYNIDVEEELRNIANQTKMQQEIEKELMEDQQKQMAQEQEMTPMDMQGIAIQKAQELINIPQDSVRKQMLMQLKQSDPQLHAMVRIKMDELKSSRGTYAAIHAQGGAPMPPQQGM